MYPSIGKYSYQVHHHRARPTSQTAWKAQQQEHIQKSIARSHVSVPGMRQLLQKDYPIPGKVLWGLAIFTCTALCIQQIVERFQHFLLRPVDVNLSLQREERVDFPSITICAKEPALFSDRFAELLSITLKTPEDHVLDFPIWEVMKATKITARELWLSVKIDDDKVAVLKQSCTYRCFLVTAMSTFRGDCVKVFADKEIYHVGAKTGYILQITPRNYTGIEIPPDQALSVYFHEDKWNPTYFSYYDQTIDHGYVMGVSMLRRRFSYLHSEEEPCEDTEKVAHCWNMCLEGHFSNISTCKLPCMVFSALPMCETASEVNATFTNILHFFYYHHAGKCKCPRRCSEVLYNTMWDVKKKHPHGATVMEVYIPDDSIEVFAEKYAYTFVRLLCDLGGTLGLFLGFCVLTILELLETIFQLGSMQVKAWQRFVTKAPKTRENHHVDMRMRSPGYRAVGLRTIY